MRNEYYHGLESEQFAFYRIPKMLYTDEHFRSLSGDAKILYGLLLDRMQLSAKNGWMDKQERVYIIFPLDQIMEALNCANQKATKLLDELEKKAGLIERKRQGLGKPSIIYVKNFLAVAANQRAGPDSEQESHVQNHENHESGEPHFKSHENHDSGVMKITLQDSWKSHTNNTDINNTDFSNTDFISGRDGIDKRIACQSYFREKLELDRIAQEYPGRKEILDGILTLLVDACCTNRRTIRISGDDKPAEAVKQTFLKLTDEHIEYVLQCLQDNTTKVRNVKQYLLAALYNAPATIGSYYQALVNNDIAIGEI